MSRIQAAAGERERRIALEKLRKVAERMGLDSVGNAIEFVDRMHANFPGDLSYVKFYSSRGSIALDSERRSFSKVWSVKST